MGLSFSLLLSARNETVRHIFHALLDTIDKVIAKFMRFGSRDGEIELRISSFKKLDSTTMTKRSSSLKKSDSSKSFSSPEEEIRSSSVTSQKVKAPQLVHHIAKPTIAVPEPVVFFSPRPVSELDAAATKVQKVYKSYRTRRNLADCAVVVEELWWKALDFASLERSSVSFFNIDKHETAISRWTRATTRVAKLGKGLSKDEKAQKLALQHWLEAIDPRHRYGHNLHLYYDVWFASKSTQPFFYWLDIGDGKEVNLEKCPRSPLHRQCIKYLGHKEREQYEVIIESGKLLYRCSGMPISSTEDSKWIFVLSTSRTLYVGKKIKGVFQHSSFLAGGAITAAGRLVANDGMLEAIWPYSGHYLPTEDNFNEFISFLEEHNVDMKYVKKCAIDDDYGSTKITNEESKPEEIKNVPTTTTVPAMQTEAVDVKQQEIKETKASHNKKEGEKFSMVKHLSCKWTSGVGPRIGCVRDYPIELQSRALEQVNLSPRINPGRSGTPRLPIPSPRPSPRILVSPRLAYMGLPSPRVSIASTS